MFIRLVWPLQKTTGISVSRRKCNADRNRRPLKQVEHKALRAELRNQIGRLESRLTFGLVFESHLPEKVRLREHPLRQGMIAALKGNLDSPDYEVLSIEGDTVVVRKVQAPDDSPLSDEQQLEGSEERLPANTLVVLAGFGEPLYAGLRRLSSVGRGGDKPSHIVVQGGELPRSGGNAVHTPWEDRLHLHRPAL